MQIKQVHQTKINELKDYLAPIKDLTTSNNQKYWFMGRGLHTEGWNPIINGYEKIQQDKIPPEAEILLNVSYEPDSQLSNLPLSIYQLLKFGEKMVLQILH